MENPKYNTLLYEKDKEVPHILYITLNRPDKSNAVSIGPGEITGELQEAVDRADHDDEVKVVIFRGAGKNFSAGFDLSMVYRVYGGKPGVKPHQNVRLRVDEKHLYALAKAVMNCTKVTIGQAHGWCIEAGLWIIECCDISIAATNAKFAHRGQRLAFGGMGKHFYYFMGHTKKITEWLITGRSISGVDAEQIGVITRAVPPEELEQEVYNLAKAICLMPLDAICFGKLFRRMVYDNLGANSMLLPVVFHTLATNITYREDEKENLFIRDREEVGEKEAFTKLHNSMEEALSKTKYFKSYLK